MRGTLRVLARCLQSTREEYPSYPNDDDGLLGNDNIFGTHWFYIIKEFVDIWALGPSPGYTSAHMKRFPTNNVGCMFSCADPPPVPLVVNAWS